MTRAPDVGPNPNLVCPTRPRLLGGMRRLPAFAADPGFRVDPPQLGLSASGLT